MFDVPDESVTIQNEQVTQLMQTHDVLITIRHKPKQNSMSIIVKGIERNASTYGLIQSRFHLVCACYAFLLAIMETNFNLR